MQCRFLAQLKPEPARSQSASHPKRKIVPAGLLSAQRHTPRMERFSVPNFADLDKTANSCDGRDLTYSRLRSKNSKLPGYPNRVSSERSHLSISNVMR